MRLLIATEACPVVVLLAGMCSVVAVVRKTFTLWVDPVSCDRSKGDAEEDAAAEEENIVLGKKVNRYIRAS